MTPTWLVIAFAALMNIAGTLQGLSLFPPKSPGWIACVVTLTVTTNVMAFVGKPMLGKALVTLPKWTVLVLTALMNAAHGMLAANIFPEHAASWWTFNVMFAVSANLVTFLGQPLVDKPASGNGTVVVLLLGLGLSLSACAPGTDGLRQACATTDEVLTGAYQASSALYHQHEQNLKAQVTPQNLADIKAKWEHDAALYDKVLAALDAATASKSAVCALAPAIDAGLKKDIAALIVQVVAIADQVRKAVAELQQLSFGETYQPSVRVA